MLELFGFKIKTTFLQASTALVLVLEFFFRKLLWTLGLELFDTNDP